MSNTADKVEQQAWNGIKERPILFCLSERRFRVAASRIGVSVDAYVDALNSGRKICGGCLQALPRDASHFGTESKAFDGLRSRCHSCVSRAKKDHYRRTRPQQREQQLRYQRENRERLYAYNAKWQRDRNAKLRAELIAAYGGKCSCCGESEPIFLDLDHVHNNGNEHRREVGNNTQVMLDLQRKGWPKGDYQLLCCNCNQGKARNGGICPHHTKNQS